MTDMNSTDNKLISKDQSLPIDTVENNGSLIESDQNNDSNTNTKRKKSWWVLLLILTIILIITTGIIIGYQQGIRKRLNYEDSIKLSLAAEQYQLGLIDLEQERYEMAKDRFEYVISLVPDYPGVAEKMKDALLNLYVIATPLPVSTSTVAAPTQTPIPDFRGEEELYASILDMVNLKMWDEAINTMDTLRQKNLDYRAVDVDGLYYIALRNRGVEKILYEGSLEPGIYDLSLAERFAPLDTDADGYRNWARLYLTGASYWDVNWGQVVYYFSQVQPAFPYLYDGSGMTSTERYRIGLARYGDQLVMTRESCQAIEYYQLSLNFKEDPEVRAALEIAITRCAEGEPTEEGEQELTPVPDPSETPVPQPTTEPTLDPTAEPSQEPTP